jgi:hypothetical protein
MRPVGTEFEVKYPPQLSSSNPYPHVARYRVVAHTLSGRYEGDSDPQLAEEIECLDYKERSITK